MVSVTEVEKAQIKKEFTAFRAGDQVRVHFKIVEGESERVQVFEGVVIRKKGTGLGATFTVRKESFGVGVERIFPIHSPRIEKIEVVRSGKVRRAKLYYLEKTRRKSCKDRRSSERTSSEISGKLA